MNTLLHLYDYLKPRLIALSRLQFWDSEFEINLPVIHEESRIQGQVLRFINGYIEVRVNEEVHSFVVCGSTYYSLIVDIPECAFLTPMTSSQTSPT